MILLFEWRVRNGPAELGYTATFEENGDNSAACYSGDENG